MFKLFRGLFKLSEEVYILFYACAVSLSECIAERKSRLCLNGKRKVKVECV
jgi:hypothetical protein